MIVTLSTRQAIEKLRAAGLSIYDKLLEEWIQEREDKHA